ncbi:gamma-tubulin complex component [Nesidiocoris tenuis]|uniref:Gamma-tubulin complex component n=1 Tax=Nesidiocoris tenuis TaxID=355587 RepID=A0ABN7AWM7_9HEMI|nr:gamma-tubulin complex component [Nesidiocoris tenuis]
MDQKSRFDPKRYADLRIVKDLVSYLAEDLPPVERKVLIKRTLPISSAPGAWQHLAPVSPADENDTAIILSAEQRYRALGKEDAIPRFQQLNRLLKNQKRPAVLNNRPGVLKFLVNLSEANAQDRNGDSGSSSRPRSNVFTEDSNPSWTQDMLSKIPRSDSRLFTTGGASGVQKSASAEFVQSRRPTTLNTGKRENGSIAAERSTSSQKQRDRPISTDSLSLMSAAPSRLVANRQSIASERQVVKELLYTFQGIQTSIFKLDHQQGFAIDHMTKINNEGIVVNLLELGYLHNRIVSQLKQLEKGGAVNQAIHGAVKHIVVDYYAMIGCINAEIMSSSEEICDTPMSEGSSNSESQVSVFRLLVLSRNPMKTLKLLVDVTKFAITGGKGGAAFSAVEILRHHGDTFVSAVMDQIVDQAGKPLMHMIVVWMVNGTLVDPHDEFFIAINTSFKERDIWRDKFMLRTNLIPSVLSSVQADLILNAGKGINFLNVIREVGLPLDGMREKLHKMKSSNIADFADPRSSLCVMLASVSQETSKLVLDVLVNEFKLFQHFQGLRHYILLGRGDFASYFLELIEPEMRKEASKLMYHELVSLLGTAIRGSTAAYDDPEIVKRVTVKILEASSGDCGSDVFGLQYLMHEPLDAALHISGGAYSYMFNFLWRTKRMVHVLLTLRKERWATKNELSWMGSRVSEVVSVLTFADLMAQEFLHFAREFHYYILFEVVECSWEKFSKDFQKAISFDDVIRAHDEFINVIQKRTFQKADDTRQRSFINDLRIIWDLVFEVEGLQRRFFDRILKEFEYRRTREENLDTGKGTNYSEEDLYRQKQKEFKTFLASIKAQYSIIHRSYQETLKKFLLDLSQQKDHELRLLSSRIDYNGYYKRADARLNDSMKFSRCSELMMLS